MYSNIVQITQPRPYRPFLPLFFSLAGWALLHPWLYLMGANLRAHTFSAALGLALSACSAFPFHNCVQSTAEKNDSPSRVSRWTAMLEGILLISLGAALGSLAVIGSLLLFGLSAAALNFAPWARLPLSWQHPFASCTIIGSGFMAPMLAANEAIDVMFLPLATWVLWLSACVGLILRASKSQRVEGTGKAKGTAIEDEIRTVSAVPD